MKLRKHPAGTAVLLYALVLPAAHAADGIDMLSFSLLGGTPSVDLRLRAEHVDNESATQARDSTASTLRTRLGYTTGKWNELAIGLEYEGVSALDKFDYNPGAPRGTPADRPVIADPTGTELNQAFLRYTGIPGTTLTAGRQRFVLDNHRFVGNVGWRQNEQTYDGIAVSNKSLPGTELGYAYFHNANTVNFTNAPMRTHLANASYSPAGWLKATLYGYWLDFNTNAATVNNQRQDTQTVGARLAGAIPMGDTFKWSYAAEYAQQQDYKAAPAAVDADYWLAEFGGGVPLFSARLGYEELGSNEGLYAVQTPLATLHAFNGWADVFLTTPAAGLRDTYLHLSGTVGKLGWMARAHQFAADFGGADYGDEYDAQVSYQISKQLATLVKWAKFDADALAGAADTQKGWLQLEFKF